MEGFRVQATAFDNETSASTCLSAEEQEALLAQLRAHPQKEGSTIAFRCSGAQAIGAAADMVSLACAALPARSLRDTRIIVPNANARISLLRALEGTVAGPLPRISTITELCLEILGSSRDGAAPLLLDEVQRKIFLEDMKVLGGKGKRIREMVRFLCRGISELEFQEDGWLITDSEHVVANHMKEVLQLTDSLLPELAGAAAYLAVREDPRIDPVAGHLIIAVGYSSYDRASQALLESAGTLMATGAEDDPGVTAIPYPYPQGFEELCASRSIVITPQVQEPGVIIEHAQTREQETHGVCEWMAQVLSGSAYATVICPNRHWGAPLGQALREMGISVQHALPSRLGRMDPRSTETAPELIIYSALGLLACPRSLETLRVWLGLGDWLTCSDFWGAVARVAKEKGISVEHLLAEIAKTDDDPIAASLASGLRTAMGSDRWDETKERLRLALRIRSQCSGLIADELLGVLGSLLRIDDIRTLLAGMLPASTEPSIACTVDLRKADTRTLYEALRHGLLDPSPTGDAQVNITVLETADYLCAPYAAILGAIDGWLPTKEACDSTLPSDRRDKLMDLQRRRFLRCVAAASEEVLVTYLTELDLEEAAQAGFDVKRIFLRRRHTKARLGPSAFLADIAPTG